MPSSVIADLNSTHGRPVRARLRKGWLSNRARSASSPSAPRSPALGAAVDVWARWDSDWYLRIAEGGYAWPSSTPAFFPLYPLLVGGVGVLIARPDMSAAQVREMLGLADKGMQRRLFGHMLAGEGRELLDALDTLHELRELLELGPLVVGGADRDIYHNPFLHFRAHHVSFD